MNNLPSSIAASLYTAAHWMAFMLLPASVFYPSFLSTLLIHASHVVYELLAETSDWFNFIIPLLSIDFVSDAYDINSSVGGHFID